MLGIWFAAALKSKLNEWFETAKISKMELGCYVMSLFFRNFAVESIPAARWPALLSDFIAGYRLFYPPVGFSGSMFTESICAKNPAT